MYVVVQTGKDSKNSFESYQFGQDNSVRYQYVSLHCSKLHFQMWQMYQLWTRLLITGDALHSLWQSFVVLWKAAIILSQLNAKHKTSELLWIGCSLNLSAAIYSLQTADYTSYNWTTYSVQWIVGVCDFFYFIMQDACSKLHCWTVNFEKSAHRWNYHKTWSRW